MDDGRFDALTIALTRRPTLRGSLLAGAGAALAGVGFAGAGPATCQEPGLACKKNGDCCATGCKKKRGKKSGRCRPCPGGGLFCGQACCAPGADCLDGDCVTAAGTCPAGADTCASPTGVIGCNPSPAGCFCFVSIGGATRCGLIANAGAGCVGCAVDDDCPAATGAAGAVCVASGGRCTCSTGLGGFCVIPCPD